MMQRRFVRFILVGVVNAIFGYGCFGLMIYAGLGYHLALLFSTVIGVVFNFKTTGRLVFQSNDNRRIIRFVVIYGFVYGVNAIGISFLIKFGLSAYSSFAALIGPIALLTFFLQKYFVFSYDQTN